MKKIIALLLTFGSLAVLMTACGNKNESASETVSVVQSTETRPQNAETIVVDESQLENEKSSNFNVNGVGFTLTYADNETAAAFQNLLPASMEMTELNGNEKYLELSTALPSKPEAVGHIEAGDVMLYQDNCVVVFYDSFDTTYSYTRIGKIENPQGLKEALGTGNPLVYFS